MHKLSRRIGAVAASAFLFAAGAAAVAFTGAGAEGLAAPSSAKTTISITVR